jgi:hypothetical protein
MTGLELGVVLILVRFTTHLITFTSQVAGLTSLMLNSVTDGNLMGVLRMKLVADLIQVIVCRMHLVIWVRLTLVTHTLLV